MAVVRIAQYTVRQANDYRPFITAKLNIPAQTRAYALESEAAFTSQIFRRRPPE